MSVVLQTQTLCLERGSTWYTRSEGVILMKANIEREDSLLH